MSGVYIKGMQMPKDGAQRCIVIRSDGSITTLVGAPIDYAKAIPVPDHGRLIDADALMKRIRAEGNNQAEQYANRRSPVVMAYGDCYGKCKDAPTIIPADKEDDNG